MQDPRSIAAGTRMPTVFLNGESPYKDILNGDPARQRTAIWHYLAVARTLPPPEGLEQQKLQTLAAGKRPLAIRTFLPGTTPRGIAIRFPNEVHAAFDAQMGRLAFAWSGDFLDMGPVWNGRGGHPAHVLGNTFWTSPAGCAFRDVTAVGSVVPNFAGREQTRRWGPTCAMGSCIRRLTFLGYHVDERGPTFRYRLALEGGGDATIVEHVTSLRASAGVGVQREVSITAPNDDLVWLHVADAESEPQFAAGANRQFHAVGEQHLAADSALHSRPRGPTAAL